MIYYVRNCRHLSEYKRGVFNKLRMYWVLQYYSSNSITIIKYYHFAGYDHHSALCTKYFKT